jgi:hypothetical protein
MRVALAGIAFAFVACGVACGGSTSSGSADDSGSQQQDTSTNGDSTTPPIDAGVDASHETSPPIDATTDGAPSDVSTACIDAVTAGHHRYTCDGFVYDVEIPDACTTAGACGLVVDVHGFTMDGNMEDANTNMRALGHTYGYVVVQPNANPKPPASSWSPPGDDDKVFAFIQAAISALKVDTKKVHFTGFSQGGMMTFRMLCKHADTFASVAPAAGTGCTFKPGDTPSREIPVLYMHGVNDALVSFTSAAVPQRDEVVAGWSMGTGTVIASDTHYTRTQYKSASGTVFEFIQHDYEASSPILRGHCYPGSTDPGKEPGQLFPFGCIPPNAFTWGEEAMKFFVAHPGT